MCPYVITTRGNILYQLIPRRSKHKKGRMQSFGGANWNKNFLFMFNKMRMELLDESSIGLDEDVPFVASPIYVMVNHTDYHEGMPGLVQVFMVDDAWMKEQPFWSSEWSRNH